MALVFRPNFDGSGNNLKDPTMNQAGTNLARTTDAHFSDGISIPEDHINAREISNIVVGQGEASVANKQGVSELFTTMGQFIDHDLDLVRSNAAQPFNITIPTNDEHFPPGSTLPVNRANIDSDSGPGTHTPAQAINSLSGWLDLSQVYGSDATRVAQLKAVDGAHLATSEGNNLPLQDGQLQAGDVRVGENDYLSSVQTLFMREHNHQVDLAQAAHPEFTADQLFNQARAITTAEYQNILYQDWLPTLLGNGAIDKYHGYNPKVDARVSEEFAGAAFRFGHSLVGDDIENHDNNDNILTTQSLAADFLDGPQDFLAQGANGFLRAQFSETANVLDSRIVDDLRNFLVDGGPASGSDLAATNIQRGVDLGLGTLNETRVDLGLKAYKNFNEITTDKETVAALKEAYHGDINAVDLWTGVIAEKHVGGGQLGQTGREIVGSTFENLRDGDRFFFENQGFDKQTLKDIKGTHLSDLIERNTDSTNVQDDVFHVPKDNGHHNNLVASAATIATVDETHSSNPMALAAPQVETPTKTAAVAPVANASPVSEAEPDMLKLVSNNPSPVSNNPSPVADKMAIAMAEDALFDFSNIVTQPAPSAPIVMTPEPKQMAQQASVPHPVDLMTHEAFIDPLSHLNMHHDGMLT